jgi:hypothetical protein
MNIPPEQIDLALLSQIWNPFTMKIWVSLTEPITREEIEEAIRENKLIGPDVRIGGNFQPHSREDHIKRIAWFVVNWEENHPIQIDFGVGGYVPEIVPDGNHRLAAALYMDLSYVLADVSGAVSIIEGYRYK